jgi:hypothetical protein
MCDADCLAFFEEKASRHAAKAKAEGSENEMKARLDYLLSRLHSASAKQAAEPFYDTAVKILSS